MSKKDLQLQRALAIIRSQRRVSRALSSRYRDKKRRKNAGS